MTKQDRLLSGVAEASRAARAKEYAAEKMGGEALAIRREFIMATLVGACLQDAEFTFEDALTIVPNARKTADAIMEAAK